MNRGSHSHEEESTTMTKNRIIAGLLLLAALVAGAFTIAEARPGSQVTTYYYTDESKTVQVGVKIQLCSGQTIELGHATPFPSESSELCN
jgi:hypothetical protein